MFTFLIFAIVLLNFVLAVVILHKEKSNRLIWHLVVCFFPVFGPLLYFVRKSLTRKTNNIL